MREKLYHYLRERPQGASTDELLPLLFQSGASDVATRVLQQLLAEDPRFIVREPEGRWYVRGQDAAAQLLTDTTFVVVDLETTSIGKGARHIIEIAAARVCGGRTVAEISQLLNPGLHVPPFVAMLTGIDDAMLADQPSIADVWPSIRDFLGDDVLVAHNARFDTAFLQSAASLYGGSPLSNPVLCTLKLARRLLPDLPRRGLDALAGHFGIPSSDRHRALGDVRITVEVWFQLLEILHQRGFTRLGEALALQDTAADGRPFTCPLPDHVVRQLPEEPGIYRFYDEGGELLYVGRARNLRERVATYLSNAAGHRKKTLELIRRAHTVRVEALGSELEAALAEAAAIRRERPPYNQLGHHLPRVAFIKLSTAAPTPYLSLATRVRRGRAHYCGPFRERHQAVRVLRFLAQRFDLSTKPLSLAPAGEPTPEGYAARVGACLRVLNGDVASLQARIEQEQRDHVEARHHDAAAQAARELSLLSALQLQRHNYGWIVANPNLLLLLPLRGHCVLAYVVQDGQLTHRERLHHADDIEGLFQRISVPHHTQPSTEASADVRIDGMVIMAAWLRDRNARDGYVFELQRDHLGRLKAERPATLEEWRAACTSLLQIV